MSDIALRFRKRAKECRRLATESPDARQRSTITKMAVELEVQADLIDYEIERTSGTSSS